jgi:hypothetical protein
MPSNIPAINIIGSNRVARDIGAAPDNIRMGKPADSSGIAMGTVALMLPTGIFASPRNSKNNGNSSAPIMGFGGLTLSHFSLYSFRVNYPHRDAH